MTVVYLLAKYFEQVVGVVKQYIVGHPDAVPCLCLAGRVLGMNGAGEWTTPPITVDKSLMLLPGLFATTPTKRYGYGTDNVI